MKSRARFVNININPGPPAVSIDISETSLDHPRRCKQNHMFQITGTKPRQVINVVAKQMNVFSVNPHRRPFITTILTILHFTYVCLQGCPKTVV